MPNLVVRAASAAGVFSSVTPSLVVEYVDSSGVRQRTTVANDGSTSITGVVPFLVHFDATATRSVSTTGDDEEGCFRHIGHKMAYGEGLGTFWTYPVSSTYSMDEDYGPPIFGHAYTTAGSHTTTYTCRDSLGNQSSIELTVVAQASSTLTTVNIPVSEGAWPVFTSSRRYTLDADGDYTSFGAIECDTLHNIVFEKTGSGADPIVSALTPESRDYTGAGGGSTSTTRAANIRTFNIDVGRFNESSMGHDYCGVVLGRCRSHGHSARGFYYDDRCNVGTTAQAQSVKLPRGTFFYNCGEMNSNGDWVIIDSFRALHAQGVTFNHNSGSSEHNLRLPCVHKSTFRNCRIYNTTSQQSWVKGHGLEIWGETNGDQPDTWDHDDQAGDPTLPGADDGSVDSVNHTAYGYASYMSFFHLCQFGESGDTDPGTPCGFGPQNNDDDGTHEAVYLCGFEDCFLFGTPTFSNQSTFNYTGLNTFHRNIKLSMGAGADVSDATGAGNIKTAPGYNTGYLDESTNTRPVVT